MINKKYKRKDYVERENMYGELSLEVESIFEEHKLTYGEILELLNRIKNNIIFNQNEITFSKSIHL